jgi:hypothetical protein
MRAITYKDTSNVNSGRGPKVGEVEFHKIGSEGSVSVSIFGKSGSVLTTLKLSKDEVLAFVSGLAGDSAQDTFTAVI